MHLTEAYPFSFFLKLNKMFTVTPQQLYCSNLDIYSLLYLLIYFILYSDKFVTSYFQVLVEFSLPHDDQFNAWKLGLLERNRVRNTKEINDFTSDGNIFRIKLGTWSPSLIQYNC